MPLWALTRRVWDLWRCFCTFATCLMNVCVGSTPVTPALTELNATPAAVIGHSRWYVVPFSSTGRTDSGASLGSAHWFCSSATCEVQTLLLLFVFAQGVFFCWVCRSGELNEGYCRWNKSVFKILKSWWSFCERSWLFFCVHLDFFMLPNVNTELLKGS